MQQRREITDELRDTVRKELPEVEDIRDVDLRQKVIEAWALCLAHSSFESIDAIEPAANPGVNRLKASRPTISGASPVWPSWLLMKCARSSRISKSIRIS